MNSKLLNTLKVSLLAVVLSFGLSYALAWTAPTATPPTGNVSAPINTGGAPQTIPGSLKVNSLNLNAGDITNTWNIIANSLTATNINTIGNVGIGTAPSATEVLDVQGDIEFSSMNYKLRGRSGSNPTFSKAIIARLWLSRTCTYATSCTTAAGWSQGVPSCQYKMTGWPGTYSCIATTWTEAIGID